MNTEHEHPVTPPLPPEIPTVPTAPLWTSILVPPLVTVMCSLVFGFYIDRLANEPFFLYIPLLSATLILGFLFQFSFTVGRRYRGKSLGFLVFSYIFGQIIVCLTLWFGCCLLIAES